MCPKGRERRGRKINCETATFRSTSPNSHVGGKPLHAVFVRSGGLGTVCLVSKDTLWTGQIHFFKKKLGVQLKGKDLDHQ